MIIVPSNVAEPKGDPFLSSTILLMRAEDGVVDKSPLALALGNNSSTITTYSGKTAFTFSGGTNIRTANTNGLLRLYTADFTMELWAVYVGGGNTIFSQSAEGREFYNVTIGYTNSHLYFTTQGASGEYNYYTGQTAFVGNWNHIAWSRNSMVDRFFLNGVQQSMALNAYGPPFPITNATTTQGLSTNVINPFILGGFSWGSYSNYSTSYINSVRVTRGVGRYTSNFTPPTTFPIV